MSHYTHQDWSQAIRCESVGNALRYELPVRPLGLAKVFGVLSVGFGLLFVAGPAKAVLDAIQKLLQGSPSRLETVSLMFMLMFVFAGFLPILFGLLILFGRCRLSWQDGQLRVTEMLGPLRFTRRLPRKPIRALEVGAAQSDNTRTSAREFPRFSALAAVFEDGSRKLVALGYPKDWLLGLAHELSGYIGASAASVRGKAVEVIDQYLTEATADDLVVQPTNSSVELKQFATGLQMTVPPLGLIRGAKGLFFFAIMWCGFLAFFTAMATSLSPRKIDLGLVIILIVFWCVGVWLLVWAIQMGRRTAVLYVEGDRLRVEIKGLFRTKTREWQRSELAAIRANASGAEINNRPVIELQVHLRTGKKVGLLAGRDEAELRWIAARLRAALRVPPSRV